MKMKELIKIMISFTFFVLSFCQFFPEQLINDYVYNELYSCENCPNEECNNQTGVCDDTIHNCKDNRTFGDDCRKSCIEYSEHNCSLCNREGNLCYACEGNKKWGNICNETCERCPNHTCEFANGRCNVDADYCSDRAYYGAYCNSKCNEENVKCLECLKESGTCTKCEKPFFKPECNEECTFCPEQNCSFEGICSDQELDCVNNTRKGIRCDEKCDQGGETYEQCSKCLRNGTCTACKENKFWGDNCSQPCNDHCPDNDDSCDFNGTCHNTEDNCHNNLTYKDCFILCNASHTNCSTCDRQGKCLSCLGNKTYDFDCGKSCEKCPDGLCNIDGTCINQTGNCLDDLYYGPKCNESCSSINESCSTCSRNETCLSCITLAFFGDKCNKSCHCPYQECNINGTCIHKNGTCYQEIFFGEDCDKECNEDRPFCSTCDRVGKCTECVNKTRFGYNCSEICVNCPGNECEIDGNCSNQNRSCEDPHFYGPNCTTRCNATNIHCDICTRNGTCQKCTSKNFWGTDCNSTCELCPNKECHINGTCIDTKSNCIGNSTYGDDCNEACTNISSNCKFCNRDGICFECKNRTHFGDYCDISCENCPINNNDTYGFCDIDGTCDNSTGVCNNDSFTGGNCSIPCSNLHNNCLTCDRDGICFSCDNRTRFGDYCNISCENCPGSPGYCYINGTCENLTALCDNDTFTGDNCSVPCSNKYPHCLKCDRDNKCHECVNKTFFGDTCESKCPNCPEGLCYNNGTCVNQTADCDNTLFLGEYCDDLCSINITNCEHCHRNATCFDCSNKTLFGPNCTQECSNCPGNCHNNGTCVNQTALCKNDSWTGERCDEICSGLYDNNCKRCDRSYHCTECINKTFFGQECKTDCFNCPGDPGICDINGVCNDTDTPCDNDSFTGDNCKKPCTEINLNCERCYRDLKCFDCINETKFGNECDKDCSNCPSNDSNPGTCYNNGICKNQELLCVDDTKYGPSCSIPCNEGRPFCKRCQRDGKCTECTSKNFHGDNCTEGCDGCSETGCNIKGYCYEFKCKKDELYGLGCNQDCDCRSNSDETSCGKFRGQCLKCKFGYFGKKCEKRCNYKCQTELCCIFKEYEDEKKTQLLIKTNYKTMKIKIGEEEHTFEIDYNYGFPLTIFNKDTNLTGCGSSKIKPINYKKEDLRDHYHEKFTNYNITSFLYNDYIVINGSNISTDIAIAISAECLSEEKIEDGISGVIGLGFFNSISNSFFSDKSLESYNLNILSYNFNTGNNEIELKFGDLFQEQINYVEKLTSCKVILDNKSDIQAKKMTCELDGIKVSKYSEAFKLNNAYITFSLGEESSLILGNNTNYTEYLRRAFFDEDNLTYVNDPKSEELQNILYSSSKINKLSDFGFVFNNFAYSYPPNKFFINSTNVNDPERDSQFLIKINKTTDRTEFVIGKEFFDDIKFTINNEEAQIYFYAQNALYCNKFTEEIKDSLFRINLNARAIAGICLAIIIFIYLIAFTIYYFVKRKKMKSGDYIRIE